MSGLAKALLALAVVLALAMCSVYHAPADLPRTQPTADGVAR